MAIFIPEWVRLSGRNLHIKRVFSALDDAFVIRRPLRPERCAADFFVQHADKGWLALAVETQAFADIGVAQLFDDADPRAAFEQRLAALLRLGEPAGQEQPIECLLLMWACSDAEVRALNKQYVARFGIRMVSREQFMALGVKLIQGMARPLSTTRQAQLMASCFPETEVPAEATTRRYFQRDNSATLRRWFLDVDQEAAAKADLDLPAEAAATARDFSVRLVNGVAGSGKTLIALNRALLLAELFPAQRVLLLIHNTPIVADINQRLRRVHGTLPPQLEITTFFAWATRQWRHVFGAQPRLPDRPQVVPGLIEQHRARWPELRLSTALLQGEMDFINEALIADEPAYQQASRAGRGFGLRPHERAMIWALYDAVTSALRDSKLRLWSALPREICLAMPPLQARLERHDHILVDEGQFFAPSWFALVKLAVLRNGQLFICADPNQGFMHSRLSWKSVGLDVAGRTKKLRRSYRTTRAILETASRAIEALGPTDSEDFLLPDYAGMELGEPPLLVIADTPQDAMDRLVNELAAALGDGAVPLGAALVIYGENARKHDLYAALCTRFGVPRVWWFNEKTQKKAPPPGDGKDHLRMAYLDTATGLEAGIVFLIGVEHLFEEEPDSQRREDNARKLYMAMTRAGQRLVLLSSRRLPAAMEGLFERAA